MFVYNTTVIVEDRATLGSDPSATITAHSIGRCPLWYRPFITNICCCHQCDKSIFFKDSVCKLTLIGPTFLELILFKKGKGRLLSKPAFIIPGDDYSRYVLIFYFCFLIWLRNYFRPLRLNL